MGMTYSRLTDKAHAVKYFVASNFAGNLSFGASRALPVAFAGRFHRILPGKRDEGRKLQTAQRNSQAATKAVRTAKIAKEAGRDRPQPMLAYYVYP